MLTKEVEAIARSISRALPNSESDLLSKGLRDAEGKDLSKVPWQFLAAELRALPPQSGEVADAINRVIAGMDLLASGSEWPDSARASADAARAAYVADASASAAAPAAEAAEAAADAARADHAAAYNAAYAAAEAAYAAAYAASGAEYYADYAAASTSAKAADAAAADARLRQRDTLLRLISEAPIVSTETKEGTTQ